MKLATFEWDGRETWGIVIVNEEDGQEWVFEPETCEKAFAKVNSGTNGYFKCMPEFMPGRKWPESLKGFLELGDDGMVRLKKFESFLRRFIRQSDPYYMSCCGHPLSEVRLRPPIPRAPLFLGLVQNCPSFWRARPERIHANLLPQAHQRPVTSFVGSGECYLGTPIGNVELGFVIGKECYNVPIDEAYDCIAGYTVVFDGLTNAYYENWDTSVAHNRQEMEREYTDWFAQCTGSWIGKAADARSICGPYLTTKDEIGNPYDLLVWTKTNRKNRDRSSTAGYSLGVERTLHFFSRFMHLHPGDVIHMGTVGTDGVFVDTDKMPFGTDGSLGGEIECCGEIWAHVHYPEKFGDTRSEALRKIPLVPGAAEVVAESGAETEQFDALKVHNTWTCFGNFNTCDKVFGWRISPSPRVFNGPKGQLAQLTDGEELMLSPIAQDLEISAEAAVVIRKVGKKISAAEAEEYILGFAPVLSVTDLSIRNQIIEPATPQERGIGLVYGRWGDGYNTVGQVIRTTDFAGRRITLTIDGIGTVTGNTDEYVCGPARCIEFMSMETTLLPGDIFLLGRVAQVIHVPQEAYQNGLHMEMEIEGLGRVSRTVRPYVG